MKVLCTTKPQLRYGHNGKSGVTQLHWVWVWNCNTNSDSFFLGIIMLNVIVINFELCLFIVCIPVYSDILFCKWSCYFAYELIPRTLRQEISADRQQHCQLIIYACIYCSQVMFRWIAVKYKIYFAQRLRRIWFFLSIYNSILVFMACDTYC